MPLSQTATRLLLTTVTLTGAAVLIFEVAAVRLLSPYYGSSLYVFSSVLTTVLLALSLGYFWGGRLADRYPCPTILMTALALGGTSLLALLSLSLTLTPTLAPTLGLAVGPLILSFLFFFVPAFILGIDSPFVIRLLASSDVSDTGSTVGSVFFWSTIGSIIGSLSAGFLLIPHLGLIETLSMVGLVVTFWAGALAWYFRSLHTIKKPAVTTLIRLILTLVVISCLLASYTLRYTPSTPGTFVYHRDGLYSGITIFDQQIGNGTTTYRFLKTDTNHSSAIARGSNEVVFSYAQFALLYPEFVSDAKRYLVLGGGAYTIPRHLHALDPDLLVDTVELEPYLEAIAYEYFELPHAPELSNYQTDARVFLTSTTTTYDVIFSDVMNSGLFIPPHLATREFYELIKARLAPGGIAFFNYAGSLDTNDVSLTGSTIKTIKSVFPNYELFAVTDPGTYRLQNIMILVRHDDVPFVIPTTTLTYLGSNSTTTILAQKVHKEALHLEDEVIFTDNQSAIEPLVFKQTRKYGRF